MRILVVDDEQLVRWFLERALTKWGHTVVTASNINEAKGRINGGGFDVMFTDLRMPEGNGTLLLDSMGEIAYKKPKIVICSAFITADMDREFKEKGFLTLKKPFKLAELQDTIDKCASDA